MRFENEKQRKAFKDAINFLKAAKLIVFWKKYIFEYQDVLLKAFGHYWYEYNTVVEIFGYSNFTSYLKRNNIELIKYDSIYTIVGIYMDKLKHTDREHVNKWLERQFIRYK